ncbi:uncharacterized protein LOC129905614 [Episyrphus balteatus]|uniref:uncharacterized protein LOC129905614 n=1 Tax=Episyrphus balteatus TaxID=286459 RepID=UPI002484E466|nr:uncharacterized protein LOC129905614 [Episyrphus balteatus]
MICHPGWREIKQQRRRPGYNSWLIVVLLTLVTKLDDKLILACPSDVCICKWKGGKQTVECGSQQLAAIPEGMDPGTQVLNFSGNSLQVLQSERFLRMDLLNLQKIYLSRNQLIRIHEKAFRGLSNLVELDLSDNSLQHVPSETFQDYTSLMRLSLSGNPIRELKTSAFRHLSFLTTLELSNCQVERIENEAFIGMDNLEWLRLDGNRIGFIQGSHILPKSLHGVSLQSNRWTCDCRLIDMHAWLVNYNTPQTEEPKCVEPPRLKGQVIKALKKDDLACLPEVTPKSTYTEISEGRNISIMCVVRALPEPRVLWLFNGQVMTNDSLLDNLHMFYYIDESGGEEKRSEVFIYNVGPEDNGTFSCVGQNIAGTTFSNYTLRVIIKEPPVVKEVSFPKDYMNYIIASSLGASVIFVVLLCTVVIKCRQKKKPKMKNKPQETHTTTNDNGMMKCSSIINGEEELSSPKMAKENGVVIGGQMKQNLMMYAPVAHHIMDNGSMQLTSSGAPTPPLIGGSNDGRHPLGMISGSIAYCSPPSSVRNYQEKNPDLINDAESVKNKLKASASDCGGGGGGAEYEVNSDCSGPCSIPPGGGGGAFDNCYQLSNQFGSQIIRPSSGVAHARFTAAMSTIPRGLHLKAMNSSGSIGGGGGNQHQVDVHLNPVCFLGQDGFAYDFSNNHLQQQQQQQQAVQSNQQQHFYRTLPHNRAHKQQQFAASAANPGTRYSLEAEFLQRTGTPTYEKYHLPHVRFTAEGYPVHPIVQYPSPPEGYKADYSEQHHQQQQPAMLATQQTAATICSTTSSGFQQWPPCLPGYHAQPIRYPPGAMTTSTMQSLQQQQQPQSIVSSPPTPQQKQQQQQKQLSNSSANGTGPTASAATGGTTSISGTTINQVPVTSSHTQTNTSSTATSTFEVKKRCVGAQTTDMESSSPIPEGDEEMLPMPAGQQQQESSSKLRHLTGPLADSPDEGYVGDSQEGSDI